jgi:hypothetical protein
LSFDRSLARVEIITASFCTNPRNFFKDTIPEITRIAPLYPIREVSPTRTEYPGYIQYGIDYCFNMHTVNCFYYFVVYKIFHVLITAYLLIPILLAIMGIPMIGLPISCKLSRILGELYVANSRYALVPGWKSEKYKDTFTNGRWVLRTPIFLILFLAFGAMYIICAGTAASL